jgi:hypothetical protein
MSEISTLLSKMSGLRGQTDRKLLIRRLRFVIRNQHKLKRQIERKYEVYKALDNVREQLKTQIQKRSEFLLS